MTEPATSTLLDDLLRDGERLAIKDLRYKSEIRSMVLYQTSDGEQQTIRRQGAPTATQRQIEANPNMLQEHVAKIYGVSRATLTR